MKRFKREAPYNAFQMKLFSAIATVSVVATSAIDIAAANAKPFVYTSVFSDSRTYEECIKSTESILRNHQFKDFEIDNTNKDNRAVSIAGYHESEYLTVEVECDQKLGVIVLAVAGIDNKLAYEIYSKLHNAL